MADEPAIVGGDGFFLRVEDAEEMRAALARRSWEVIIADYRLPRFDAAAALVILHQTGCDTPFIVVSGNIGEELAVSLMKSGARREAPRRRRTTAQ